MEPRKVSNTFCLSSSAVCVPYIYGVCVELSGSERWRAQTGRPWAGAAPVWSHSVSRDSCQSSRKARVGTRKRNCSIVKSGKRRRIKGFTDGLVSVIS